MQGGHMAYTRFEPKQPDKNTRMKDVQDVKDLRNMRERCWETVKLRLDYLRQFGTNQGAGDTRRGGAGGGVGARARGSSTRRGALWTPLRYTSAIDGARCFVVIIVSGDIGHPEIV